MRKIYLSIVILSLTISLGSPQVSFGSDTPESPTPPRLTPESPKLPRQIPESPKLPRKTPESPKPPGQIEGRLGLLASTLGVAPVPGASYGPDQGSNFEGDGSLNGGGSPGESYAPISGIPAPGDSYGPVGGVQGGKHNGHEKCECVPKQQCAGRPGSVSPGSGNGHGGNGGYPPGGDPGLTIGNGPNNNPDIDGSGVIDIRIVNKPPGGVICLAGDIYCCNSPTPVIVPSHPGNPSTCGVPTIIPVPGYNSEYGQADFGEYPWMTVILSQSNNYLGAGALLDSFHVLTAAHKVKDYKPGYEMKVRFGEWNAQDDSEPNKNVEIEVDRVDIHPGFNSENLHNDIAIVKLRYPVDIGAYPHIKPVCLPKQGSHFVGKRCWVSGFGKDAFKVGKHSYYLKEVDLPIVESNECEARLRRTRLGNQFTLNRKSFLCAGGEDGKDACTGDGGAPLVCKGHNGQFQVVGLVAWGIGCAEYGIPGVYVNIPNFIDWIHAKLY